MSEKMNDFINQVREIVKTGGTEEEVTARVAVVLEPILDEPNLLNADQLLVKKEGFTLNRIHVEPDESFSIGAGIWDVGQTTPIHDHGTWGVIGIYRGMENEESFLREGPREEGARVNLKPQGKRLAGPGDVFVCCTKDQDVHRVSCASPEPVVGIHVYGDDLAKLTRYKYEESTGEVNLFVTGWDYAKTSA
ncbi:MAG: cysteine dioxygenase family protein [Nitrospinae bacterium]|nr:cysteine dioxygenase family protein [Nitrospinota bacterium]